MALQYNGQTFMTDEDLKVKILGFFPNVPINNHELLKIFQHEMGRDFLGGDELVAYAQPLVSRGMDFGAFEAELLADIQNPQKPGLKEIIFKKISTGIGRGHSLGGLSGVVLGIHGTKMIDSGLTGLVASRSLVTSSRRRETTVEEIVIPTALIGKDELLKEYLALSKEVLSLAEQFKERFKGVDAIQTFNKTIPYNNPADLFIVLPLDTLATLAFEVQQDKENPNGNFVPRELHTLVDVLNDITRQTGINVMYGQRTRVPRDTYLHYTVFKDPSIKGTALEEAEIRGMPLMPIVIESSIRPSSGFNAGLQKLIELSDTNMGIQDPKELAKRAMQFMLEMRSFVGAYNENARVKVLDSLSWRVWSEQKRHATLRQDVESVYSAVARASEKIEELWPEIEARYAGHSASSPADFNPLLEQLREAIVIDKRMEKAPELLAPYIFYTAKQLRLFQRLVDEGIESRDALFIAPKNIRVRTAEHYDLGNLIALEYPLRLCNECEPERQETSWQKREVIAQAIPELSPLLFPKCLAGFCTEGNYCRHLTARRKTPYTLELHRATKKAMLEL